MSDKVPKRKFDIGDRVWVAYLANGWGEKLQVGATTILGVYCDANNWYYGTGLSTRHGSPRYCDINEMFIFTSKDEAIKHLINVQLHRFETDATSYQRLADQARENAVIQRRIIEEQS